MEAKRQNTVSQAPQPPLPGTSRLRGNAAFRGAPDISWGEPPADSTGQRENQPNQFVHTLRPGWSTQFVGLCAVRVWGPLLTGD